jgi:hypothetical protein
VGGCAAPADKALKKPISPVDLFGPNKSLATGTVVTLREKGDSVATVSVSGKDRSVRGGGTVKGELSTRLEVLEIKDGKVSKIKISDGSGKIEIKSWQNSQKSNTAKSHPLAGRTLTLDFISGKPKIPASLNEKQKSILIFAATGINDHALYPLNPVKVGHQWELSPVQISRLLEAVSVASDVSDHMRKFAFTGKISFVGVKNYQNQQCAVLRLTLDGSGQVQGAATLLKVSGTILRSLQHHRNLQQNLEMKMDGSGQTSGIVFKHSSSKKSTVNYQFEISSSPKATPPKATPPKATPPKAFTNTLGMKFVPVSGTEVSFCIWETRVKDYAAYAAANAGVDESWKKPFGDEFKQADTHPVVKVSWNDANAFCAWLTKKELAEGKIKAGQKYRLPTDAEWSVAVGLGKEKGNTPQEKSRVIKDVYPWGKEWPPPVGAGNYSKSLGADNFEYTSPVGSFAANKLGLHDMGGNVWEWCEDKYRPTDAWCVLRGASWRNFYAGFLLSSSRRSDAPGSRGGGRGDRRGIRCVLVGGSGG